MGRKGKKGQGANAKAVPYVVAATALLTAAVLIAMGCAAGNSAKAQLGGDGNSASATAQVLGEGSVAEGNSAKAQLGGDSSTSVEGGGNLVVTESTTVQAIKWICLASILVPALWFMRNISWKTTTHVEMDKHRGVDPDDRGK